MIKDLAQLQKLFKLCRKQGVDEISIEGVTIKFGSMPLKAGKQDEDEEADPNIDPLTGLTLEELTFMSVTPQGGAQ